MGFFLLEDCVENGEIRLFSSNLSVWNMTLPFYTIIVLGHSPLSCCTFLSVMCLISTFLENRPSKSSHKAHVIKVPPLHYISKGHLD